jgi:hypothetical protein
MEEMIPAEPNNGIGDGAESLENLLKEEVCDESGHRYLNGDMARKAGLKEEQFGATYCPEYLEAVKIKNSLKFGN